MVLDEVLPVKLPYQWCHEASMDGGAGRGGRWSYHITPSGTPTGRRKQPLQQSASSPDRMWSRCRLPPHSLAHLLREGLAESTSPNCFAWTWDCFYLSEKHPCCTVFALNVHVTGGQGAGLPSTEELVQSVQLFAAVHGHEVGFVT